MTEEQKQEEDDLLNVNKDQPQMQELVKKDENLTEDGALKQENEDDFDPGSYSGYPQESWNRYFGSINDKRQGRQAKLAQYLQYRVRCNPDPNAEYPDLSNKNTIVLTYFPITKSLWEQRRMELAEIEDLTRHAQLQATRLAEVQEALRLRVYARNKPRGMVKNREDPDKASFEEIQSNMAFFKEFEADISSKIAELRQKSDINAFKMYFHKGKEVYDQVRNEDIDDILGGCDHKQFHGPQNLTRSEQLPIANQQQGVQ